MVRSGDWTAGASLTERADVPVPVLPRSLLMLDPAVPSSCERGRNQWMMRDRRDYERSDQPFRDTFRSNMLWVPRHFVLTAPSVATPRGGGK